MTKIFILPEYPHTDAYTNHRHHHHYHHHHTTTITNNDYKDDTSHLRLTHAKQ